MLMTRLTRGSRTSDRNHHQGWYQDVDQGGGQEYLVDRECRGRHLAVERSVENISAVEPEDVDVGEHEQHRDPQCAKHEFHVDLGVSVLPGRCRPHGICSSGWTTEVQCEREEFSAVLTRPARTASDPLTQDNHCPASGTRLRGS